MTIRLTARAQRPLGDVPRVWRPSAMYLSSVAPIYTQFQAIPGPRGIVRLPLHFGANNPALATDLTDYIARVTSYCNDARVMEAVPRGTCIFEINGTPKYLSSISDAGILAASGWEAYRAAAAADLSASGAWYQAMFALVNTVMNTFKYPSPRSPTTGKVQIGRPGIIFEFWNEPNGYGFYGGEPIGGGGSSIGTGLFGDWLRMLRLFVLAGRAANAQMAFAGPVVAGYQNTRTDQMRASWSADFFRTAGGPFAGGTENTGRRDDFATRSAWKFPASKLVANQAISALNFVTSCASPTGTVSSDTYNINVYGANGQGDPQVDAAATRYDNCSSGTAAITGNTLWRTSGDGKTMDLAAARTELQTAITAGANFSIGAWCTQEASGGAVDHTANPRGYDTADLNQQPRLDVTYTKTIIEIFCDYCAAQGIAPDMLIYHNFQSDDPTDDVAAGAALIASALASAGLDRDTPFILDEFQNSGAPAGGRDDYRIASYFLSTLWEHQQAGVSAMCEASLIKQGNAPAVSNLFTNEWGQILNGTTSGYYIPCPNFMAMRLFSQWQDQLSREIETELSEAGNGLRSFATRYLSGVSVVVARWDPAGAASVDLEVQAVGSRPILYADVYRFASGGVNDPAYVYANTAGTSTQKADAALAASAAATSVRFEGRKFTLALGRFDSFIAQFTYVPVVHHYDSEEDCAPAEEPIPMERPSPRGAWMARK